MMEPTSAGPRCERIVFSGRVQGVGFRQHTRGLAGRFPLVGYVRNQADGTVELVARGPLSAINGLIQQLQADFPGHITAIDRSPFPGTAEFEGFEVRF